MYIDYQDAVLKLYAEKKGSNGLSLRLSNPSPAKIKDECLALYQSGVAEKDRQMLMLFLEVREASEIVRAIKRGRDKFKPLDNYLRDATGKTEDKNIELLAWLLGFEPRPFSPGRDYSGHEIDTGVALAAGSAVRCENKEANDFRESIPETGGPASGEVNVFQYIYAGLRRKGVVLRLLVIAILGLAAIIYFNSKARAFGGVMTDSRQCMIWSRDSFERVSCDSPGVPGLVLPFDESRFWNLHRITRPDTLTVRQVGKVWYRKRGRDSLDLYTAGGQDPVNPGADLRRLSLYMFNKHLRDRSKADGR